ncbi:MAG TPA: ATP-binding protein [Longimicrobiaceae bacterium]|nr:ATP-binding protein [Longimicrobiaceae bacterium]
MENPDAGAVPWLSRITADGPGDADAFEAVGDLLAWLEGRGPAGSAWPRSDGGQAGYRAWFHGPPGSGKTRAAALAGKQSRREVYRIDLPGVLGGWSGETEKELANLFASAEANGWILFFDEADALFGRREEGRSPNDRSANQQVAYLLQRIEDFPGLVILATDLKSHLDEAFVRRLQAILDFPSPDPDQRRGR